MTNGSGASAHYISAFPICLQIMNIMLLDVSQRGIELKDED